MLGSGEYDRGSDDLEAEAVRTVSQKKLLEKLIKEVIEDNKSIEQRFHRY